MPKLFVTNTMIRDHELTWRWSDDNSYRGDMIRAGQQKVVIGDLPMSRIKEIIQQNEKYGLRAAKDLVHEKGFIGLTYNIDGPTDAETIEGQFERNKVELNANADDRREATAAAMMDTVSAAVGKEVRRMEIEQVETGDVNKPNSKIDNPSVAVGTELVGEGTAPRHKGKESNRANR